MEHELTTSDKLIINDVEIPVIDEAGYELECSFGAIKYSIDLWVERGSKNDQVLEEYVKNKDKYILEVNLKRIEE